MPIKTKNFTMYDMKDPEDKKKGEKAFEKEKKKVLKKTDVKKKKEKPEKLSYKTKEEIASEIISKFPKEEEKTPPPKGPGRPEKITSSILQKLKVCFSVDMTNEESAYFCGISERTLQYYLEKNPEFLQEKEILKKSITLQAKFNLGRKIKVDESKTGAEPKYSLKRLEKKDPEFKNSIRIETPAERSVEAQRLIDELALE